MKFLKLTLFYVTVAILIIAILTPEVEARRRVLRGRRTVTRNYYRPLAIPAWAIVGLVGIGQLIIGGIIFLIMKRKVLDPPLAGSYTPANTVP